MRRAIRNLSIVVLSLFVLLVAAGIVITKVINPNDYKPQIISAVNKATGRQLNIDGDINLSLFPWLGVDINKVKLSNPQGFSDQAFLEVGEAEIKLHLIPLLVGKIELGTIVLNHANLNLIKKSANSDNWSDLISSTKNSENTENTNSENNNSQQSPSALDKINITSVSIQNSHIQLNDESTKNFIELKDLNLDSSGFGMAKKFPVYLSFKLLNKKPKLAVDFQGNTHAYIDLANKIYQLKSLEINGQLSTAQAKNLAFSAKGDFKIDLKQQAWNLKDVNASLAQMSVAIDSNGDLSKSTGDGAVVIKSFNAQGLLQQLSPGIKFANSKALTNVSAKFSYSATPEHVQIPDFIAKIDNSNLQANFDYQNAQKRSLNYFLKLDQINLDKYRVHIPPAPRKKVKKTQATTANPAGILAFLTNLDGHGKIQIGQLIYNQIPLSNLLIQSSSSNNIINIKPIRADVYQGNISAVANINLQGNTPIVTADATLSNLDLNKALSKNGSESRVNGLLNLQTHLNTSGKNPEFWVNNLQGNGTVEVTQGVIKGVDLNFWLLQGVSVLKKLTPSLKGNTHQTPFNGMKASFTIYQGVLSNQDLVISTQDLSAKGRGTINLPQQSINYHLYMQSNDKSLLANNLQIPVIITGPLADPKVQLDMAVLTASLIKQGLTAPVGAATAIPKGALDILSKIPF